MANVIHDGAETLRKRTPMELLRSVIEEQNTAECDALHELHGDKNINDCNGRRCSDCVRDSLRKAADLVEAELDALKARTLPEGMEWLLDVWPRWSNGERCRFGDWWKAERYGNDEPRQLRRLAIYTPELLDEWEQGDGDSYGYDWDFMRPS